MCAGDVRTDQNQSVVARHTCLKPKGRQQRLSASPELAPSSTSFHHVKAGGSEGRRDGGLQPWCLKMAFEEAASPGLSRPELAAVPAPAAAAPSGFPASRAVPPHLAPQFTPFGLQNTEQAGRGQPEPWGERRRVCASFRSAIPALWPEQRGVGWQRAPAEGTDPRHGVGWWADAPASPRASRGPGRRRLGRFWWV